MNSWKELLGIQKLHLNQALPKMVTDCKALSPILHTDKQRSAAVATYMTILQLAKQVEVLLQNGEYVGGPELIFRGMLESWADLCALVKKPGYVHRMMATYWKELVRLHENADKYGADLAWFLPPDFQAGRPEAEKQLKLYKDAKNQPLQHRERFEEGGILGYYLTLYWIYSIYGHNNVSALRERHVSDSNNTFTLVKPTDPEQLTNLLDLLLMVVLESSAQIHGLFKTALLQDYIDMIGVHEKFRETAKATIQARKSWPRLEACRDSCKRDRDCRKLIPLRCIWRALKQVRTDIENDDPGRLVAAEAARVHECVVAGACYRFGSH